MMPPQDHKLQPDSNHPIKQTLFGGVALYFEDQGREIIVKATRSGKEIIVVDGETKIDQRCLRRKSVQSFTLGGDQYEVEYHVVNLLMDKLQVTLVKNGVHVKTYKVSPFDNMAMGLTYLLSAFCTGIVAGAVMFYTLKLING